MAFDALSALCWLLDHAGCKPKHVAGFVGVEPCTITRWRSGESKPGPENQAAIEDLYHRVQAYCACRAPAVLPAECFDFICSYAEQRVPDHASKAQKLLSFALARICPDYKKLLLESLCVHGHATPWAIVGIPVDLHGAAHAHVFRAVCGPSAAFVILIDESLRGESLRNALSTEFCHVLDHVVDRSSPPVMTHTDFMEMIRCGVPVQATPEKVRCRNCQVLLQASWTYCPSCGVFIW